MPSKEKVINAKIHHLYNFKKGTFMLITLKKSITLSALLLLLPMGLMANLSKQDKSEVTKLCTDRIAEKGYKDYTYQNTEVARSHSGSYAMTGQLHKDGKYYEFNCVLNTDIKALKIEGVAIDSIDPVPDTNTSKTSH